MVGSTAMAIAAATAYTARSTTIAVRNPPSRRSGTAEPNVGAYAA
jgi:hypothetical protein